MPRREMPLFTGCRKQRWIIRWQLMVLLLPAFLASAYPQVQTCNVSWGDIHQISNDSVPSLRPEILVTSDTIHILWYGIDTLGTVSQDGIQYCHSYDGGATFSSPRTLVPSEDAFAPGIFSISGSVIYVTALAAIDTFYGTILLKSTDAGISWNSPFRLLPNSEPEALAAKDSLVFLLYRAFAGNTYGILSSADYGHTWHPQITGVLALSSLKISGGQLVAVGPADGDFVTEVGFYSAPLDGRFLEGPTIVSTNDNIPSLLSQIAANERGYLFVSWTDTGTIFYSRSRDLGVSWDAPSRLSVQKNAVFSDISAAGGFVGVTWDNDFGPGGAIDLRTSNDFGVRFCPVDTPTSGSQVGQPALNISGTKIRLVWSEEKQGNGEIYYREGTLSANTLSGTTPVTLAQNYPNPLVARAGQRVTTIHYEIAEQTHVNLAIYNILGQKVAQLVDADQLEGGYDVVWRITYEATGVYFYRLRTGLSTETKKLVVLR